MTTPSITMMAVEGMLTALESGLRASHQESDNRWCLGGHLAIAVGNSRIFGETEGLTTTTGRAWARPVPALGANSPKSSELRMSQLWVHIFGIVLANG
jgi:hypothetical protein